MIPLPQVLYLSGFGEISPCFLQDLQSNLCECQRLSCSDVVDYAVLTKLGKTFAATNTPRAHAALTKEDEHVNLFSMHWEGGMQLLVCKRAHQCSKPTRSSRTPSPRTCDVWPDPPVGAPSDDRKSAAGRAPSQHTLHVAWYHIVMVRSTDPPFWPASADAVTA